ncbi:MAG: hypothetical protein A4E44_01793 [Methanosaeta sp. PtaB.Bin018]|jgi:predicted transcriptional regulator|nr:hypothetical protein [Methanothrix sp.]OPX74775.1 MAG: hypothetical protein A4E44_01793 [Methanosaeta sp. PtaB.Bin018]OPY44158.1 MAG: hypothetical protein A4E46_01516 [Methanosaeta sp. PtaU1.Bin016]HOV52249.1 hypothetical protein [Methanothrix sp.]
MPIDDPSDPDGKAKWWETAEEHRFALEVLQLPLRREILRFISSGLKSEEQIENEFKNRLTWYHLSMLVKALVIERSAGGYKATPTGVLYLEKVESRR